MALPNYVRSPLCLAKRLRIGSIRDAVVPITERMLYLPSSRPAASFVSTAYNRQADGKELSGLYATVFLAVTTF